jgi:hypothetical protein
VLFDPRFPPPNGLWVTYVSKISKLSPNVIDQPRKPEEFIVGREQAD